MKKRSRTFRHRTASPLALAIVCSRCGHDAWVHRTLARVKVLITDGACDDDACCVNCYDCSSEHAADDEACV